MRRRCEYHDRGAFCSHTCPGCERRMALRQERNADAIARNETPELRGISRTMAQAKS